MVIQMRYHGGFGCLSSSLEGNSSTFFITYLVSPFVFKYMIYLEIILVYLVGKGTHFCIF